MNILSEYKNDYMISSGNQNTLIGTALNILKMKVNYKAAIFEVGINEVGAMEKIAKMLNPTIGLIVNIGHSHMKGLGLLPNIAEEKRKLFKYFKSDNIAIINGDQELLSKHSYNHPILKFGLKTLNQVQARKIEIKDNVISFVVKIYNKKYNIILKSLNCNYVINSLAAISVAKILEIKEEIILKGIEKDIFIPRRFEFKKLPNGSILIDDTYNSNPESVKSTLMAFRNYKTDKKKIVVLGDMLELGDLSDFWHRQIGRFFGKVSNEIKHLILIGKKMKNMKNSLPFGVKSSYYEDIDEPVSEISKLTLNNTIVLFKASNGMKFDKLKNKII